MSKLIQEYTLNELQALLSEWNQPSYRAKQLYEWLHTHNSNSYDEMTNLPKSLRDRLKEEFPISEILLVNKQISSDGTRKYLLQLYDGQLVETVGIPLISSECHDRTIDWDYDINGSDGDCHTEGKADRLIVCFSTQAGCPMQCSFCATGKQGFKRNLSEQEMVDQILFVQKDFNQRVSNIVAMGQGEPFLNYDNVISALKRMNHDSGLRIGARHITLSTCGIIDGIDRFTAESEQFTLAISLHSAIQPKRNDLMPRLESQHLTKLRRSLEKYIMKRNRRVTFEYMMIDGVNDGYEDLDALLKFCDGLLCHVNLIPLNEVEGFSFKPSSQKNIMNWKNTLNEAGISATLRKSKGSDICGACGQLKNFIDL